jgi:flagellum-specific ATP synthase
MIRLGAYRMGSDPKIDESIKYYPLIEDFLRQAEKEESHLATGYQELAQILAK